MELPLAELELLRFLALLLLLLVSFFLGCFLFFADFFADLSSPSSSVEVAGGEWRHVKR